MDRLSSKRRRTTGPTTGSNLLEMPEFEVDDRFPHIYSQFKDQIKPYHLERTLSAIINFQVRHLDITEIQAALEKVFKTQPTAFKLKISLGYILRDMATEELHYYRSSQNNQLLVTEPETISTSGELAAFQARVGEINLMQHVTYPNSRFTFVKLTNVTFFVTKLLRVPIGSSSVELPNYLVTNRGLYSLTKVKDRPYKDNLCLFRCLALHMNHPVKALEIATRQLFDTYKSATLLNATYESFQGVSLDELEDFSRVFGVGVNVYSQSEDGVTLLVQRTLEQENLMNVNLYENHFSFIKNMSLFSKSFLCPSCKKSWKTNWQMKRHLGSCSTLTREVYYSGSFELTRNIFERLSDHNIVIPQELRFFDYRIVFDIECALVPTEVADSSRTHYTHEHQLASISVCSNVPHHEEPVCLITNGDSKELIGRFIDLITEISVMSYDLNKRKFADYIPLIAELEDEETRTKFEEYISQIPVLSFNGSRYDIPVTKTSLFSVMLKTDQGIKNVIKRGNSYAAITADNFKFLDVTNYLAAGTSYDKFLKAYQATVHKSFFPYEYFDSLDKLTSTTFPRYTDFYSSLKQANVLEPSSIADLSNEERDAYGEQSSELSELDRVVIGHMRYDQLKDMFESNGWTFADFLAFYNNRWVVMKCIKFDYFQNISK